MAPDTARTDGVYLRQMLSGRDFAVGNPIAEQMVNFAYAIGDAVRHECVLVDPAYAPGDLIGAVRADGYRVVGVLVTHYHADHAGGDLFGHRIPGLDELGEHIDVPIHVQSAELEWITKTTGLAPSQFTVHQPGDRLAVGDVDITLVHTPGHTPGSQCFLVDGSLVAGDTLFLDGCGRTDLPGSDPAEMVRSLQRLATIDDAVELYPGHRYSAASSASMGFVKANNWVFDQLPSEGG